MTNENRNRVHAGVPTGGQFAAETHTEPGVTLTAPAPLDRVAVGVVKELVQARSNMELGTWQRRMDKGGGHLRPTPPVPEVLVELERRAQTFETLPREEQDFVLDQLKMPGAKHLLDPGQKLGTDKIRVADDVEANAENLGLALAAQKIVADADIRGTITMTRAAKTSTSFTIEDGGTEHRLRVRAHGFAIETGTESDDPFVTGWMDRATIDTISDNVFESRMSEVIGRHYKSHRESAALMAAFASSPFREAGDVIGGLNRQSRMAGLRADGAEYTLHLLGDEAALSTVKGEKLHPSMVGGFLSHVAAKTGCPDGAALASDLREVFREADRRLIP